VDRDDGEHFRQQVAQSVERSDAYTAIRVKAAATSANGACRKAEKQSEKKHMHARKQRQQAALLFLCALLPTGGT
jgi:hypothetical protein